MARYDVALRLNTKCGQFDRTFLSLEIDLFNHATCHTWAATAKWSWMI